MKTDEHKAQIENSAKKIYTDHSLPMPDFVSQRISNFQDRLNNAWGGSHLLHGLAPGPSAIHLYSNDYLCLSGESDLINAQAAELFTGKNSLMSAIYLHGDNAQNRLERKIACYLGAQDGIISQSGWAANVGLLQSLAGPKVPVYLDMQAHASLWEGVSAAKAMPIPFRHNDICHMERQMTEYGPGIVAVDSVYSTNGSMCPLASVIEVSEKRGCIIVVDESHSLGTHGPHGAGLVSALGMQDRVHFRTASLAKAAAGRAGFITCSTQFKEYFMIESRPAIFSSCVLRHEIAWLDAVFDFLQSGICDARRMRLKFAAQSLRDGLDKLGYNVGDGTEQIIALEAGLESQTMILRDALQSNGIFGAVFCAPATPRNRSLMRLTVNAGLTDIEIERILFVCEKIRDQVQLSKWSSTRRRKNKMQSGSTHTLNKHN